MPEDPVEQLLSQPIKLQRTQSPVLSDTVLDRRANPPTYTPSQKLPYMTYDKLMSGSNDLYSPLDFPVVGQRIRDNVVKAIESRFPVVGENYTIKVENVRYEKPKDTELREEKEVLLHEGTLQDRLKGDWVLYDNKTGKELQRKVTTLLNVPRMTDRGTFIRNGSEIGLKHMFRLRSGVYTHIKNNGQVSAHINPEQTTGQQMSLDLDQATGVFSLSRGTRTYGLLPMLKAAGVPDEVVKKALGEELYKVNYEKYKRMLDKDNPTQAEYKQLWDEKIAPMKLDPETTESTLGKAFDKMDPDVLLRASNRVLQVSRTMSDLDTDDRDSLRYQRIMGPADYIPERIVRDGGGLLRKLFNRIEKTGNLDEVQTGTFQPQVDSVFLDDKHAGYIDGSSPLESMDFATMVSRLGEGGIGDLRAAPAETRAVNDSYLNFVDPVRSPECAVADTEVLTKEGWRKISDIKFRDMIFGIIDGKPCFTSVLQMNEYDYDGEVIGYDDGAISFLVTPDHRLVFAESESEFKEKIVYAKDWDIEKDNKVYIPDGMDENKKFVFGVWTLDKTKYFKRQYKGKVYCPTVTGGMIAIRRNDAKRAVVTGNSLKVGLDIFLSYGVMKDSAGNLYNKFKDKTGKPVVVPMNVSAASIVATPEFYNPEGDPEEFIPAMYQGKGIEYVKRKDVDFYVDNSNRMMSVGAGMIPLIGGIRSNRTLMGCLDPETKVVVVSIHYIEKGAVEIDSTTITADALRVGRCDKNPDIYLVSMDLGRLCLRRIKGIRKVNDNRDLYKVTIATGVSCKVNGIHKWRCKVLDPETVTKDTISLLTTEQIKDLIDRGIRVTIPTIDIKEYHGEFLRDIITSTYGSGIITDQLIQSIEPAGKAEYLVDIDVDDNVYLLANGMFTHNSKYGNQAVPLTHGEAPLVQRKLTLDSGEESTTERFIGRQLGARFSPVDGIVTSVDKDFVTIKGRDGEKHRIDLYNDYPANQKGYITSRTLVKPGDRVKTNQILAATNYTDDEGTAALGTNLRVAFLTGRNAGTFEDSIQVSETAAKTKLASTQLYKVRGETTKDIEYNKQRYLSLFKDDFTPEQLAKIDDNGLPKPGTVFEQGDPMYLGVQTREIGVHGLAKNAAVPYVTRWEHEDPGTVTNVVQGRKHMTIYTKCVTPMKVGDKLCFDDKTQILTDKGWKFFKDLNDTERVLTLDLYTGDTRLTAYSEQFSYDYKGKMYSLENEYLSICVTPDHDNIVTANTSIDYVRKMKSKEVFGKTVFYITGENVFNPHNFKPSKTKKTKEEWIDYDGRVYCVTVPQTHNVFVRRNGKPWWSGNSSRFGSKGVLGSIIPDDQMPRDANGVPFDVLQSPLGVPSRLNTSMLAELQLAKIAKKTGKTYALPDFMDESIIDYVDKEMKANGVEPDEDIYDPVTGKTIPNVQTGTLFFYKLKHMAELKGRSRSTGTYSSEDVPLKGEGQARRFGAMETSALYGGGGMEVLRDAKIVRGQRNDEFWRDYRSGKYPETPGFPLVHQKFFAHLKAAGINLEDRGDRIHIYGATEQNLRKLTGDRQVTKAATYDSKDLRPVAGGLFDPTIFGTDGDQWGYVEFPEPVLNPMMFKPIGAILGWKDKELSEYLSGERKLDGKFGSKNLIETLNKLDLPRELAKAKQVLKSQSTTLEQRDLARKRIRAIEPMLREGKRPEDFFVTRMPILPPKFRPVTEMSNGVGIAADVNFLYKRMMDSIDDLVQAKKELPEELQLDARRELYNSVNAVTGLEPTDDPKLSAKGVAGVLKWAFGKGSPKLGSLNRKVFGSNLDLGAINVITPDNSLTIDQVGVPELTAWKMFEPFVVRKLVQGGASVINAMKEVLDQTPEARRALVDVMKTRPILINRAPTLWRYGIQGQYPILVKGNSLHINPNICNVMAADYDGDQMSTHVPVSQEAIEAIDKHMLPSRNLLSPVDDTAHFIPRSEFAEGLYLASRTRNNAPIRFRSKEDMMAALKKGEIKIDTPVIIG